MHRIENAHRRSPDHDIVTSTEAGALAANWADFVHIGPWVIESLGIRPNRPTHHKAVSTHPDDFEDYPHYFPTVREAVDFCHKDNSRMAAREGV